MTKNDLIKVRVSLLEYARHTGFEATESLRILDAALAAPEPQQPVAWMGYSGVGEKIVSPKAIYSWMTTPLYTAPVAAPQDQDAKDAVCEWTHDGYGNVETECGSGTEIAGDGEFRPKFCFNCGKPTRFRDQP